MIGILFVISLLVLLCSITIYPFFNGKKNIIFSIILNIILVVTFNVTEVFILSLLSIKATLIIRLIINFSISIFLIVYMIIKKKKTQKYFLRKTDVLIFVFIISLSYMIYLIRFTKNNDIYFETTDPAAHYNNAILFANSNQLTEKRDYEDYFYKGSKNASLFYAYVSYGTVIQIEQELGYSHNTFTRSFIYFEIFILAFTGFALYYAITLKVKKISLFKVLVLAILVLLFLLGYPCNNLIFGYHYLGISIMIMLFIISVFEMYIDKKEKYPLFILMLLLFNVFTSYYLFVPVIFGACGCFYLYQWLLKKTTLKETIKIIMISLFIPFILGMLYYFVRRAFIPGENGGVVSAFGAEGYIYRNLISNFFLPLLCCVIALVQNIKNKEVKVSDFAWILNALFLIVLFCFFYNNKIASYYFYKLYYPLWGFCFVSIGNSIFEKSKNVFATVIIAFMSLLLIYNYYDIDNKLSEQNPLLNTTPMGNSFTNIYWFNKFKCDKEQFGPIYTKRELDDIVDLINNNELENEKTIMYADLLKKLWFYNYSNINPNGEKNYLGSFYEDIPSYEEIYKNDNIKYLIVFDSEKNKISNKYFDIKYSNKSFTLLVRTNIKKVHKK